MAEYPSSIRNFIALYDGTDKVIAAHPKNRGDEITALQTLIGAFGVNQGSLISLKILLIDFIDGCKVEFKSASDIYVRAGQISITDASENIRWRRNSADLTGDWGDIDTGAEASDIKYYVYACADNAGTTFTIKISINSTTPSGAVLYRKIGSFYNNSSGDIDRDSVENVKTTEDTAFGTWETKSDATTYLARTDGFVCAYRGPNGALTIKSDAATPPTIIRSHHGDSGADADDSYGGGTVPVKKGDYWLTNGASNIYWLPIQ